ncbi:MAG TPA: cell division protein FtsH, partial [Dehalococcoidia bacterium]|nr:cell division protein FtsH [Dehalococcoidia bacterium]
FKDMLAVSLAGRAAEELVFQDFSTGAESDISQATKIARKMVMEYGMSQLLGPRAFGRKEELVFLGKEISEQRNYSEKVALEIDQEVQRLISEAYQTAKDILREKRAKLNHIAQELIAKETIEGEALATLFQEPAPQPAPSA